MNFNLFNSIRVRPPKRNRFNLSHGVKTTLKFGELTPIMCVPVLPGDTFKLNTELLARFAPFQAPVMHKVKMYTHFFFVPNRLIWDNWKDFITGGEDGTASPVYPRLVYQGPVDGVGTSPNHDYFGDGSLADYLGFPTFSNYLSNINPALNVWQLDLLPFRAYNLIYNEYYRDQNLTDPVDIRNEDDGITTIKANGTDWPDWLRPLLSIKKRSWKKDYFTSALPFAQRGEDVMLPLTGDASLIYGDQQSIPTYGFGVTNVRHSETRKNMEYDASLHTSDSGKLVTDDDVPVLLANNTLEGPDGPASQQIVTSLNTQQLQRYIKGVDLSNVNSATINELRRAIRAQEFLEISARAGSRYIEQIYAIFGVRSSDARLQRPEFLGGGSSPVVISDVLQTSQTTDGNPLGTPAGHGVGVQGTHSFKRTFEEHGFIIGIMSVMPMPAYQQGMPRVFQKFDRLDYYWPQFAHLGEQEIKQGEIMYTGVYDEDEKTFGYTPRYAEYKYIPDSVHGDFRSSLSFWHMGRIFTSPPKLNEDFLTSVADAANRPFSVQDVDVDKIWVNIQHNLIALRKMPVYGTPRL